MKRTRKTAILTLAVVILVCLAPAHLFAGGGSADKSPSQAPEKQGPQMDQSAEFDVAPVLVSMTPPKYPKEARKQKIEGTVQVRALVSEKGVVEESMVTLSVHPLLDAEALKAVHAAIFKPAQSKGRPISVWVAIPVRFALH